MRGIVIGAILSVGHLFAGWSYNPSAKTLTGDGDNPWVLNTTAIGSRLTVKSIATVGQSDTVDLSSDVVSDDSSEYNIVAVGKDAFRNNTFIANVILPASLQTIGDYAFDGCSSLKSVTPFLPQTLTSLGAAAFRNCVNLSGDLSIGENVETFSLVRYGNNGHHFYKTAITSVVMGDSVTVIQPCSFALCNALTSVVLSKKLTTIDFQTAGGDSGAFLGCEKLRTVTPFLPTTLTVLGHRTFSGCTNLIGDLVLGSDAPFDLRLYGSNGHHFYKTAITSVRMGEGITEIPPASFALCTSLTNVVLSTKLTAIKQQTTGTDSGAFAGCEKLRTVTPFLPTTLTSLGYKTFSGCTNLIGDLVLGSDAPFTLEKYGNIGDHFRNTAITSVRMGEGVVVIPSRTFASCSFLTNAVLSTKLLAFGQQVAGGESGAFQNCEKLRTVTPFLPATLTSFGYRTFSGCTNLTGDLVLGGAETELQFLTYGQQTKYFYDSLVTSVCFMPNALAIPDYTLENMKSVRDVYFYHKPRSIGNSYASNWNTYQARINLSKADPGWEAYIADPANVTPWDELDATLVQAKYWENFSGRAPYGLGKVAPFKDQWIVRWNPSVMGSLMIIK